MFLLCSLSWADDPQVELLWARRLGRVAATPPPGWHLAPDAPSGVTVTSTGEAIGRAELVLLGDPAPLRFALPAGAFHVEVQLSVCEDAGTTCRPVTLAGDGTTTPRGRLALTPRVSAAAPDGHGAAVRLYDFAGVWCPPCTLLATEVLHDPADAPALAGLDLQTVDVDRPESWTLKDRYGVGGYPTLVAVDAEGGEVARLVGYPGEAATLGWLASLSTAAPLARLEAGDPTLTGAAASTAARRLAEAGKSDAARAYFGRAADDVDLHVARLQVDGARADAEWLLAHAPPGDWVFPALDAAPDLWPAFVPFVPRLDPVSAADLVDLLGASAGGDAARAAKASAIVILQGAMTGDPDHDKAHVGYLAELYAGIGRLDDGLVLLDRYDGLFPAEFTYDHVAARLLLEAGRAPEAEVRGRAALDEAWGDQRLRAVQALAKAVAAQGRRDEAVRLLDEVVATAPKPAAGVEVRTTRYLTQIAELRASLVATVPAR